MVCHFAVVSTALGSTYAKAQKINLDCNLAMY